MSIYIKDLITSYSNQVPWIFIYRDPDEIYASYYRNTTMKTFKPCLTTLMSNTIPHKTKYLLKDELPIKKNEINKAKYCAAHLAALGYYGIEAYQSLNKREQKNVLFINYKDILDINMFLKDDIGPLFHLDIDNDLVYEKMLQQSTIYSKRHHKNDEIDENNVQDQLHYIDDSEEKLIRLPHALKLLVLKYMKPVYKAFLIMDTKQII